MLDYSNTWVLCTTPIMPAASCRPMPTPACANLAVQLGQIITSRQLPSYTYNQRAEMTPQACRCPHLTITHTCHITGTGTEKNKHKHTHTHTHPHTHLHWLQFMYKWVEVESLPVNDRDSTISFVRVAEKRTSGTCKQCCQMGQSARFEIAGWWSEDNFKFHSVLLRLLWDQTWRCILSVSAFFTLLN